MKEIIFETPFASYKATSILGQGGSGVVYEVFDESGNRFALKRLSPERITSEKRRRFKNEIFFCERNSHPNILTVVDSGFHVVKEVKCPFYVMQLYDETLRSLMEGSLPSDGVLPLFSKILDGVEAAHLKGIWHRDVKPENILFDSASDKIVVADFGIAHFSEDELLTVVETKPTSRLANFQYAAPEQRVKSGSVDHRADIYALGLLLNEMFTGEVIQGVGYKTIASVSEEHAYLDTVVNRMVRQDSTQRYQSIDDLKKDLIGHRNQFVARQKVLKLSNEVVEKPVVADPLVVNPIEIVDYDLQTGYLVFQLSAKPNSEWVTDFHNSAGGLMLGVCEPRLFSFRGTEAQIDVSGNEKYVQQIINYLKDYTSAANSTYKNRRMREAAQQEQRERELHLKRIEEAKLREEVLRTTSL